MAWIKPQRVRHALANLNEWRKSVQDQGSKHLLPLLALLEQDAGSGREIHFDETPHEYDFWDRYFLLGDDPEKPYFNPLTLRRAERGFPHSNAATIRKNTFALKWRAASRREGPEGDFWRLAPEYATIFRDKALTKSQKVTRIPVVDLSLILFRERPVEPPAAQTLETMFRQQFPQSEEDYHRLFSFRDEDPGMLFEDAQPTRWDVLDAVLSALLPDSVAPSAQAGSTVPTEIQDPEDPVLGQVQELLRIGTSGIILCGPPGTGKTYYAHRIADSLVRDPALDVFRVQFHPSFGYEDFVEGYRPDDTKKSGFGIAPKIFLRACERARGIGDDYVVLVVDEINRGDPARVFGELLTYIERSYRGIPVTLPFSGNDFTIPPNLLILGTMNPHDRSVTHVDAAFVRRFDHIDMLPSREAFEQILQSAGFSATNVQVLSDWFESVQGMFPFGLGHAIFSGARDIDSLKTVWRYRVRPIAEVMLDLNAAMKDGFVRSFEAAIARLEGAVSA